MPRSVLTEFRVGVFVILGLVLSMVMIFMIGGEHHIFARYYTVFANFQSTSGLRVGAPVQLAGFRVGFVDKIKFNPNIETRQLTVNLRIRKEYQDRIRSDSIASVETQGLLGDKFIYITMGSDVQAVIPDKGIIATKETTSIFAMADKVGSIMDNIEEASKSLNDLLSGFRGKKGDSDLKAIAGSLRRSMEQVEKGKGLIHAMIFNPNGEKIIDDLARTMKGASEIAGGKEGSSTFSNIRYVSADLRTILDSIRRGEGTLGKLIMDPSLYEDIRALVGRANRNTLMRAVIRSTIQENESQLLK
jgi:phospholipid/cholesterol/gamma-HCH transport system substrate-binding protein